MKSLKSTAISCIATVALLAGGLTLSPSAASAAPATPCGTTGTFIAPNECSYTTPTADDTFTVPVGVTSLSVIADGASGGAGTGQGGAGPAGGAGAQVVAGIPVTAGNTEYVEVDIGGGGLASGSIGIAFDGAGGGGLSGVYNCSGAGATPSCALVVAGGGGGDRKSVV